jgi:predicted amidohydrolase
VGDSAIIDPLGRTLTEASIGEAVLVADVTAEQVIAVRETLPFLRDRR